MVNAWGCENPGLKSKYFQYFPVAHLRMTSHGGGGGRRGVGEKLPRNSSDPDDQQFQKLIKNPEQKHIPSHLICTMLLMPCPYNMEKSPQVVSSLPKFTRRGHGPMKGH